MACPLFLREKSGRKNDALGREAEVRKVWVEKGYVTPSLGGSCGAGGMMYVILELGFLLGSRLRGSEELLGEVVVSFLVKYDLVTGLAVAG